MDTPESVLLTQGLLAASIYGSSGVIIVPLFGPDAQEDYDELVRRVAELGLRPQPVEELLDAPTLLGDFQVIKLQPI